MRNFSGALAAVDYLNPLHSPEDATPHFFLKDLFITLGVLIAAAVLLILVVAFLRRKEIRQHGNLSRSAWPASASKNQADSATLSRHHHRHRKKRRREHRPRNPTLYEAGGLPPKRADDQPPKAL